MMTQEQVNVLFDSMREFYRTNGNSPLPERHLNVIEIKEGPELDRAVAEAIGLINSHRRVELFIDPRDGKDAAPRTFNPSTDLNDAFKAAEVFGVINSYRVLRTNRHHWEIYEIGESLDRVVSSGETPALAICAAILKV